MRTTMCLFIIPLIVMLIPFFSGCVYYPVSEDTDYYGVLIGINDYEDTRIPDLSWSVNDATGLAAALQKNGWGNDDITLVTGSDATKESILTALQKIIGLADSNDYVLVYFSGHGTHIPDESGDETDGTDEAIVPVDAHLGEPSTYITDDELSKIFSMCRTEKGVIIFDACNSGGIINSGLSTGSILQARTVSTDDDPGDSINGDLDIFMLPVITASGQREYSWEDSTLEHGIFTYFFLDGFNGLRADANGDSYLTIQELFYYAKKNTEFYFRSQHPQLKYSWDTLDLLITR